MSGSHAPQASTDDRELLAAHLRGDAEAFGALVSRHRDRLWAVAVRTLGDRDEAADALQDALISAFRGAATYRGDAAVTTWLHRIVVNACLDRIRRRQARPTVPLGNHDIPTTLDAPGQVDVRLAVRAAQLQDVDAVDDRPAARRFRPASRVELLHIVDGARLEPCTQLAEITPFECHRERRADERHQAVAGAVHAHQEGPVDLFPGTVLPADFEHVVHIRAFAPPGTILIPFRHRRNRRGHEGGVSGEVGEWGEVNPLDPLAISNATTFHNVVDEATSPIHQRGGRPNQEDS